MSQPIFQQHIHFDSYSYENERVLENIDLTWGVGETLAILGPSGCGKSTLLRVLMGFEKGAQGFVKMHPGSHQENRLENWNAKQRIFGLVPQVPHLFPWKTVIENLALGVSPNVGRDERDKRVAEVLEKIGLQSEKQKYPAEISVGMASRVSFARTLLVGCETLLLDEPFAALDATTRYQMQMWLLSQLQANLVRSAIFVTHDVREALLLADKIVVFSTKPARMKLELEVKHDRREPHAWLQSPDFFAAERALIRALNP